MLVIVFSQIYKDSISHCERFSCSCTSKMTSSLTVTFSGKSSVLCADFFPEITLESDSNYSCALLDLIIYQISNLDKIKQIDLVCINCDIISGSYINGKQCHTIHQFAASTSQSKNKTFVEIPKHISYLPVETKNLRSIQISIVDYNGKLVDIAGGTISCRINIKKD